MKGEPFQPGHALQHDRQSRRADVDAAADVEVAEPADGRCDENEGTVVREFVRRRIGGELAEVVLGLEGRIRWRPSFGSLYKELKAIQL